MTTIGTQSTDTLLSNVDQLLCSGTNTDAAAVKDELQTLFVDMETENEWDAGAQKIQEQIEKLEARIGELQEEAEEILAEVEEKKGEASTKSDSMADTAADLTEATEEFADNVKNAARMAARDAVSNYSAKSGDSFESCFNEAFMKRLGGLTANQSTIQALYEKYKQQSSKVSSIAGEIESALNEVSGLQSQLDNVNATISMLSQMKTVMENITSEEELSLIAANNIDISETLEDGSPRYVFAKGADDGEYHIYDMSSSRNASLARLYGDGGGYDIIESGNGYMYTGLDTSNQSSGETVFYLKDEEEKSVNSMKGTYDTCSPLSFDLNGDGVKTSETVIQYDIDGDGVVDNINDSADAVLVFDKDGDGISGEDGSECFGDNTDLDGDGVADGYANGFEALAALAKSEGLINDNDDLTLDENDIKTLEEKYGLKIKTGGYLDDAVSLSDAGITEINLSYGATSTQTNFDGNGNDLMTQEGATFTVNGEEHSYADIWHAKLDGDSANPDDNSADNDDRYSITFDGQEILANDDLSQITMHQTQEKFDSYYEDLPEDETISAVKEKLEEMLDEEKKNSSSDEEDSIIPEDEIAEITGLAYLLEARDRAEAAAELKQNNSNEAADAAEEAVSDYFEEVNITSKDEDDGEE